MKWLWNNREYALRPCGCGAIPPTLHVGEGNTCKYAFVSGGCCGEWFIEFRTDYHAAGSPECMKLAIEAWNDAPRADSTDKEEK